MSIDQPVILSAKRTPIGKFLGGLSRTTAPQLGAHAIKAALMESGVSATTIEEVFMGCVLQAGVGRRLHLVVQHLVVLVSRRLRRLRLGLKRGVPIIILKE